MGGGGGRHTFHSITIKVYPVIQARYNSFHRSSQELSSRGLEGTICYIQFVLKSTGNWSGHLHIYLGAGRTTQFQTFRKSPPPAHGSQPGNSQRPPVFLGSDQLALQARPLRGGTHSDGSDPPVSLTATYLVNSACEPCSWPIFQISVLS